MDIGVHGLDFSLLSTMISDLNQTARFTNQGIKEANPFVKDIVEPKSSAGELALGAGGLVAMKMLDEIRDHRIRNLLKAIWLSSHAIAVRHNEKHGHKGANIIFPVLQIKW